MGIAYSTFRSWRVGNFGSPKKGKGWNQMPIRYRVDILEALKSKGYSTYKLRREKLLAEHTLQQIRGGILVSWANIEKICALLECQPGDILEYVEDGENK